MNTLVLPYPISSNRYWATRVVMPKQGPRKAIAMTYVTPEAVAYKATVANLAKLAGLRIPFDGRVAWTIRLYPQRPLDYAKRAQRNPDGWDDDVRCIDLGNCEKVLADALNGVAWVDDKQIRRTLLERHEPDAHGARVVVSIERFHVEPIAPELFRTAPAMDQATAPCF